MINNFTVKANSEFNELSIKLDGYFMKSEIELAFYLVKKEIKKLIPGFSLKIDIDNLNSSMKNGRFEKSRLNRIARMLGAGEIRYAGLNKARSNDLFSTVGFYPYENEWFLY